MKVLKGKYGNFQKRLQECIDVNGGYLLNVVF